MFRFCGILLEIEIVRFLGPIGFKTPYLTLYIVIAFSSFLLVLYNPTVQKKKKKQDTVHEL